MSYILSSEHFQICAQASLDCYHQKLSFPEKFFTLSQGNRMQGREMSLRYFVPGYSIFLQKYNKNAHIQCLNSDKEVIWIKRNNFRVFATQKNQFNKRLPHQYVKMG